MARPLGPLVEHLAEFRTRVLRSFIIFCATSTAGFFLTPAIISLLLPPEGMLVVLGPMDAFMVRVYFSLAGGFILAFPFFLFEAYQFVRPALLPGEKKMVLILGVVALLLFLVGVAFAWWILPPSLQFLLTFMGRDLQPMMVADRYFGFIFWFLFLFGVSFELPIVLFALLYWGVLSVDALQKSRRFAVVAIFILAAIITPTPDMFTLTVLAIPLYILYEVTLLVAKWTLRGRRGGDGVRVVKITED